MVPNLLQMETCVLNGCLLYVFYLYILEVPPSNSLKLTFYDSCIDSSVCPKKSENNQNQLRYFSERVKQECTDYERITESMNEVLQFCIDMENSFWYGGVERTEQRWPLNKLEWTGKSYVSNKSESQAVSYGVLD